MASTEADFPDDFALILSRIYNALLGIVGYAQARPIGVIEGEVLTSSLPPLRVHDPVQALPGRSNHMQPQES